MFSLWPRFLLLSSQKSKDTEFVVHFSLLYDSGPAAPGNCWSDTPIDYHLILFFFYYCYLQQSRGDVIVYRYLYKVKCISLCFKWTWERRLPFLTFLFCVYCSAKVHLAQKSAPETAAVAILLRVPWIFYKWLNFWHLDIKLFTSHFRMVTCSTK